MISNMFKAHHSYRCACPKSFSRLLDPLSKSHREVETSIRNSSRAQTNDKRKYGQFKKRIPFLPPDVNFALNLFEKTHLIFHQPVQRLINAYRKVEYTFGDLDEKRRKKRNAFIVLEGLDGCGKSVVGKRTAFNIGAEYRISPPDIIKQIRSHFENASLKERAAYYTIGNYIVAMQLLPILSEKHVILDRFWHSTSAFHIAEAVRNDVFFPLPPKGDKIYQWPSDLLKPDLVIFFDVTEELRVKRHCNRGTTNTNQEQRLERDSKFRNNVLKAYSRMYDPKIVKVNADPPILDVVATIEDQIKPILVLYEKKNRFS